MTCIKKAMLGSFTVSAAMIILMYSQLGDRFNFTRALYRKSVERLTDLHVNAFASFQQPRALTSLSSAKSVTYSDLMDSWTKEIERLRHLAISSMNTSRNVSEWHPVGRPLVKLNQYHASYMTRVSAPQYKSFINTTMIYLRADEAHAILPQRFYDYTSNNCQYLLKNLIYGGVYLGSKCYNLSIGLNSSHAPANIMEDPWLTPHGLNVASRGFTVGLMHPLNNPVNLVDSTSYPATYFHVLRDALAVREGDVYCRNMQIVIQRCSQYSKHHPGRGGRRIVDEMLTTSQLNGYGFYHFTNENLPRLAMFVKFLRDHPNVKIHVHKVSFAKTFLRMLGIDPTGRLVSGVVGGRIVYLPAGNPCGRSSFFNVNLLSHDVLCPEFVLCSVRVLLLELYKIGIMIRTCYLVT